jgi:hypothetical protein
MSSILLSFVGNQDPASEQTNEPGSIVTLVHHLLEQDNQIGRIVLLYTFGTKDAAILTKEWLIEEISNLKIAEENIELIPVDNKLSEDPVDLLLAIQAARQALEKVKTYLNNRDFLELNASSGTPVMKSAWSILQAAGYASQSRVWQVRNPHTKEVTQARVFQTNVDTLKKEFDLKIIKQQVEQYDYNGALITFEFSNLVDNGIKTLLKYGSYRLACAFPDGWQLIAGFSNVVGTHLHQQSKHLAEYKHRAIIVEIYFQALIKLNNREYSDALVKIFAFLESVLYFILKQKLLSPEKIDILGDRELKQTLKQKINDFEAGQLKNFLLNYPNNVPSFIKTEREIDIPVMMAIADYFYDSKSDLFSSLKALNDYRYLRNDYIHQLKGISGIDKTKISSSSEKILKSLNLVIKPNPFELLNQKIHELLDNIGLWTNSKMIRDGNSRILTQ